MLMMVWNITWNISVRGAIKFVEQFPNWIVVQRGKKFNGKNMFDYFQGLLYGAAIGDALGLSTAQMSPDECCFHYDEGALCYQDIIIDKYRLQWEKGDWTTAFDQMVRTSMGEAWVVKWSSFLTCWVPVTKFSVTGLKF